MKEQAKLDNKKITQEKIMATLDKLYAKAIDGVPAVSLPINELANEYLAKTNSVEKAAKKFIAYQVAKCTTSGFINGLGGIITLPVAIPANIASVLYVQMRMIACLAYMGGYELNSDQVQTLVYVCLAGISVDQILKHTGIQLATKLSTKMLEKLPKALLGKINKLVGFKLFTKFGTKGVINLHKAIPVVGGIVGGALDFSETKFIGNRAYKLFIKGDTSVLKEKKLSTEEEKNIVSE